MAFAVKDGRATAVLAGVVTKAGGEYDVLARVAAAQQWILAATGHGLFPAVKVPPYRSRLLARSLARSLPFSLAPSLKAEGGVAARTLDTQHSTFNTKRR